MSAGSRDGDSRARVREFVTQSLRMPALADSDDIFEVGGASSLFAAELVLFIEDTLGTELCDDDLERANFFSIDAISALVERRRADS